jgi:hypothetical protein
MPGPKRSSRFVVLVLAAGAAGCGGVTAAAPDGGAGSGGAAATPDGGGAGSAGTADAPVEAAPPVTVMDGCNQVATALCDSLNRCFPVFVVEQYGDEATCISRSALSCMTDQSVEGIARTPDDLVACAKAAPSTACSDAIAGLFPAACEPRPGTVANGVACGSSLQCQSTYCNKTDACGVCGPRHDAGGDCSVNEGCNKGLVCANKVCVAPAALGQPCNLPSQPCRLDLYCTAASGPGTCAARIEAGGSCADNTSDACDTFKGAVCNTIAKANTCVTINVAKGGQACSLASKTACVGGIAPCSDLLFGGVCASPAQDGDACGGNAVCVPPATCVNKICRLPSATACH